MIETALSWIHVIGGGLALGLGPVAMQAPKRIGRHSRVGEAFFFVVLAVCASGAALAVIHWETRALFLPIALGTAACAVVGYAAAKRRWPRWLVFHVLGQGSAYTAMVTAFVVANWDDVTGVEGTEAPLVFLLPMAAGTIAFAWLAWEVHGGRRPRRT